MNSRQWYRDQHERTRYMPWFEELTARLQAEREATPATDGVCDECGRDVPAGESVWSGRANAPALHRGCATEHADRDRGRGPRARWGRHVSQEFAEWVQGRVEDRAEIEEIERGQE